MRVERGRAWPTCSTRKLAAVAPGLESHFRYLSGLLFAIGVAYVTAIPRIETQGMRIYLLTGLVVMGGIGRVFSLSVIWPPSNSVIAALAMELLVAPAVALWHYRATRSVSPNA